MVKRTRPGGGEKQKATVLEPLNAPTVGCCTPFPDATFVNQELVKLYAHHRGQYCMGHLEPLSIGDWNAEVDARSRAGGDDG